MKRFKYLLFSLLCMFCSCLAFAKDEITIEKMIPVYDENSGVIVSEENGVHSVVFNDKDQNVKFNIVLRNNTKRDISLKDIVLPESPEEFFKYEFVGIDEKTVLESNSTEEVVLSLETIKTEGWGRNFTLDITDKVEVLDSVVNPNTSVKEIMVVLVFTTFVTGIIVISLKNKKISRYVVLTIMFGSLISVTNAKDPIILPIKLNVSFESQNVMAKSYTVTSSGDKTADDTAMYRWGIKNIYFDTNFNDIENYEYKFDVSDKQNEKIFAYFVVRENELCMTPFDFEVPCYDVYMQADGFIYMNPDSSHFFAEMIYLENIYGLKNVVTSKVYDMSDMFSRTGYFVQNFTLDLSSFDTSSVTNMSDMFYQTAYLDKNFTLDLSNFDTSNVTDMSRMFGGTGYNSSKINLDLSCFDTSKVTDMSYMFANAGGNNPDFVLNIDSFDTSNVTNMSGMFNEYSSGNKALKLDLDLSHFDTSNVTDMSSMFAYCGRYNSEVFLDISSFDTSNVTDMSDMFMYYASGTDNLYFKLEHFDTSNVTDMSWMFHGIGYDCQNLYVDLSNLNVNNVLDMSYMFDDAGYNAENVTIILGNSKINKLTDASDMFEEAGYNSKNISIDLSHFDTSNVTDMSDMFYKTGYNSSNVKINLENFDTSNVTDMSDMFREAGYSDVNFTLDINHFDTSVLTSLSYLFYETGYNSTKLNIEFTIRNPIVKYYTKAFVSAATKSGSKITLNYTKDTESLVNQMIDSVPFGCNVVKGVQVD